MIKREGVTLNGNNAMVNKLENEDASDIAELNVTEIERIGADMANRTTPFTKFQKF